MNLLLNITPLKQNVDSATNHTLPKPTKKVLADYIKLCYL